MAAAPEPRIDRSLTLHFKGDWGIANLHRVCGWLSYEIGRRSGPHTGIATWSGRVPVAARLPSPKRSLGVAQAGCIAARLWCAAPRREPRLTSGQRNAVKGVTIKDLWYKMAQTPIPPHAGAERCYREAGVL